MLHGFLLLAGRFANLSKVKCQRNSPQTALPLIFKRLSKDLDTMEEEKALHVSRASHPGIKVKSYG
jgi:hypothetical protein